MTAGGGGIPPELLKDKGEGGGTPFDPVNT